MTVMATLLYCLIKTLLIYTTLDLKHSPCVCCAPYQKNIILCSLSEHNCNIQTGENQPKALLNKHCSALLCEFIDPEVTKYPIIFTQIKSFSG